MLAHPMTPMDEFGNTFGDVFRQDVQQIVSNPSKLLNHSLAAARVSSGAPTLDILSAESYPSAPLPSMQTRRDIRRKASQQLFGGFSYKEEAKGSSTSSNEVAVEIDAPPKRSKRKSTADEDNSKRQRGRPRLDTQDETAADRRRTQIRLAQRAYRHRKETTIAALQKRVGKLEKTIQTMNRTYVDLHDNLIDTGLFSSRPSIAQQLRETADQFATLTNLAAEFDDNEEEGIQAEDSRRSRSTEDEHDDHTSSSTGAKKPPSVSPQDPLGQIAGYDLAYSRDADDGMVLEMPDLPIFETTEVNESKTLQTFQQWNVQIPETRFDIDSFFPVVEKPLQPAQPYTYSFQETSFARRLHRLCLERAYHSVSNPDAHREFMSRAFRFTFCFSNKKSMLIRFQELLKRKAGESLENWNVPFFPIGGAGTHFPRRDEAGNPIYPPNMQPPASVFRPLRWLEVETPRDESTTEKVLEAIGYGGEWFDAHDVEEYLKTKGIFLDGTSSFVEVDPTAISLPPLTTSASTPILDPVGSPTHTPSPVVAPHLEGHFDSEVRETFANNAIFDFLASAENPDKASWSNNWDFEAAAQSPSYAPTLQDFVGNNQRTVTIDVSKFLERMIEGSACLGRAPGFRKSHIDSSLALSLQEAF